MMCRWPCPQSPQRPREIPEPTQDNSRRWRDAPRCKSCFLSPSARPWPHPDSACRNGTPSCRGSCEAPFLLKACHQNIRLAKQGSFCAARLLLKADVSGAGEGWSDSRIIKALETSPSMVYRVRKQLVEGGFEAVLSRKQRATPAVARIFDGEKEAKLIALACSKPPKGRARWTLRLLENKVVELGIVDRA